MVTPSEQSAAAAVGAGRLSERRSGVYKNLLEQHGEAFALVKRLGMRSADDPQRELQPMLRRERSSFDRDEKAEVYAALRALVQAELLLDNDESTSDLADAVAALDAINPGSPEWDPTFLLLNELVEARLLEEQHVSIAKPDDSRQVLPAG
jgi:hypothetical protein